VAECELSLSYGLIRSSHNNDLNPAFSPDMLALTSSLSVEQFSVLLQLLFKPAFSYLCAIHLRIPAQLGYLKQLLKVYGLKDYLVGAFACASRSVVQRPVRGFPLYTLFHPLGIRAYSKIIALIIFASRMSRRFAKN